MTAPSLEGVLALRDRSERDLQQRFFVEGVRFLITAVDSAAQIDALIVVPARLTSPVAQMIVRRLKKQGVPLLKLTPEQFTRCSRLTDPQGVGAILRQRWSPLTTTLNPARDALFISVDHVRSPGNLGTLLRTCDAVSARGLLCGPQVDPYDPSTVRATMGSLFTQHLIRATPSDLNRLRSGYLIVGAAPTATHDYRTISYRRPTILVLGSEREGLSASQRALCNHLVRIPMQGRCDSLNLAVAASLLLYEIQNQRHPPAPQLRSQH